MNVAAEKRAVRERDGGCADCGMSEARHYQLVGKKLHIHRLHGPEYVSRDCRLLCCFCHAKAHGAKDMTVRLVADWQPPYERTVHLRGGAAMLLKYLARRYRLSPAALVEKALEALADHPEFLQESP